MTCPNRPHCRCQHDCLEFSDHGRSEQFPAGWWIIPGVAITLGVIVWLVV